MTQHTPGPWKTITTPTHPLRIVNCESTIVCNVLADIDTMPECKANARLIAAAPELLKACRLMLDAVNEHHKDGSILWVSPGTTAWELLTDAIGKATGENLQKTT